MKKLLVILFLFAEQQIFASEDPSPTMNRLSITPNFSIGSLLSDGSSAFSPQNELCYEKIMQNKLQYQHDLDVIQSSLAIMHQDEITAVARYNKYSELIRTEERTAQEIQQNLSLDKAYAILAEYQECEKDNTLSPHERARMMRMKSGLDMLNVQVKIALEQVKGITISKILSTYPCNDIYLGIRSDCIAHQAEIIAMYKNYVDQSILQQRAIAEQRKLKVKDQSIIVSFVRTMDELSEALVSQNSVHISPFQSMFDPKAAIALQSLYRMKKVQQGQELIDVKFEAQQRIKAAKIAAMSKLKASQFKNNLAGSVVDSIFERVFVEVDKKEQVRLKKEQIRLQETADNQKMVGAILTSVIDKAAIAGELNIIKKLEAEKQAEIIAKNKALQQQAQQEKKAKALAVKEKAEKEHSELNALLAEQMADRLVVQEAFAAVQTAQHQIIPPTEVVDSEQFVINRKNVAAKTIGSEQRKTNRFTHLQALRSAGITGGDLKSEMARYDEYLDRFSLMSASEFLLDFQKKLKPSMLHDQNSWESFLQAMDGLKNNACDLDIDENGKTTISRKITELFNILYPQFGHYNADFVEQHIHNQEQVLHSCNNRLEVCNQVLNQTQEAKKILIIQRDIKKIQAERDEASMLYGEAIKAQNMFYIMTKLRKLQLFGGVFQKQIVSSIEYHDLVTDKFYEVESLWMKDFEISENFIRGILEKKSYVESSDCQMLLLNQYKKFSIPASDIQLAAFDSAYLISNMLEGKVDLGSEFDMQQKLFSYLHHVYPTYSLELIEKMTKTQMIIFVIMKKISMQ